MYFWTNNQAFVVVSLVSILQSDLMNIKIYNI